MLLELLVRLLTQYPRNSTLEKYRRGSMSIIDPLDNKPRFVHQAAQGVVPGLWVAVVHQKRDLAHQPPHPCLQALGRLRSPTIPSKLLKTVDP